MTDLLDRVADAVVDLDPMAHEATAYLAAVTDLVTSLTPAERLACSVSVFGVEPATDDVERLIEAVIFPATDGWDEKCPCHDSRSCHA